MYFIVFNHNNVTKHNLVVYHKSRYTSTIVSNREEMNYSKLFQTIQKRVTIQTHYLKILGCRQKYEIFQNMKQRFLLHIQENVTFIVRQNGLKGVWRKRTRPSERWSIRNSCFSGSYLNHHTNRLMIPIFTWNILFIVIWFIVYKANFQIW